MVLNINTDFMEYLRRIIVLRQLLQNLVITANGINHQMTVDLDENQKLTFPSAVLMIVYTEQRKRESNGKERTFNQI